MIDSTAEQLAVETLRESEGRQAFLIELIDQLSRLTDPDEIMHEMSIRLGQRLGLATCLFADVDQAQEHVTVHQGWNADGVISLKQTFRLQDYLTEEFQGEARAGTATIVNDTANDPRTISAKEDFASLGVGAFIAIPFHREGQWTAYLGATNSKPRGWSADEMALFRDISDRVFPRIERARAEAALRASEERYRSLFETISQGFSLAEVVRDAAGNAVDWRLLEMNPVFEEYAGMTVAECVGRTASDVFGGVDPHWLAVYDRVVRSRKAERSEAWFGPIDRWVGVDTYPGTGDQFTVLYEDISERKRTEAALRESEERQAFLLKFSDALRPLGDAVQIQGEATRLLREQFEAGWCYYAEFEESGTAVQIVRDSVRSGLPSLAGYHEMQDLPGLLDHLSAGKVMHAPDLPAFPLFNGHVVDRYTAIGMQSFVGTPLVKQGRLIAFMMLADTHTRQWNDEIDLLNEAAERTWAAVERTRAEAALVDSEERFRALSDAIPALAWRNDAAGNNMFVNHHFREFTGKTADDIRDAGWHSIIHPDDADDYIGSYLANVQAQRSSRGRGRYLRHDGAWRWHEYQTQALWSVDGRYAGDIGVSLDVTERIVAESALRESEERLRQFGEASQDILWIRDATTLQWTYLTPAFDGIYGLSREEALSGDNWHNWEGLIVDEDRERAVANIIRARDGEKVNFEYRIKRPIDGEVRWLRNTDFPMRDEAGRVVAVGGVGSDITRLKAVEAEIAAAEVRLRTLMEGIPQLVWRSCADGLWTWSSPQWRDFTGQTQEESHGRGWLAAVHPDDREAATRAWEEAKPHGMLDVEYRVRRAADGAWFWHHTRSVPVRDDSGRIVEWLGTTTDVNALRELQDRQSVLVAELQHRTRNLMGVVRSMGDKTARASADLPDFRHRFRDRLDALARVQGLLSRMNDHNRVTFDELVGVELAAMDGSADRVAVDGPAGVRLRSSTVQTLAMALHELATNAIKYGALGQASGRLAITWRLEPPREDGRPWLHIDWRESGVEMPPPGAAPRGTGQGRELIERALPYQLNAKTSYELGPDGARCTISVPVSASTMGMDEHA